MIKKKLQLRSYGSTASLVTKVSAAVLQKNVGYTYIEEVLVYLKIW